MFIPQSLQLAEDVARSHRPLVPLGTPRELHGATSSTASAERSVFFSDFQPSPGDYGDFLVKFEPKLAVRLVESSDVCRFFGIALPGEGPTEFET